MSSTTVTVFTILRRSWTSAITARTLWEETRRLVNPHGVYVDLSQKLYDMKISLLNQMSQV